MIPYFLQRGFSIEDARSYAINNCMAWQIPGKNIVNRPTSLGGRGYHICGDHRQTVPALYHLLVGE